MPITNSGENSWKWSLWNQSEDLYTVVLEIGDNNIHFLRKGQSGDPIKLASACSFSPQCSDEITIRTKNLNPPIAIITN